MKKDIVDAEDQCDAIGMCPAQEGITCEAFPNYPTSNPCIESGLVCTANPSVCCQPKIGGRCNYDDMPFDPRKLTCDNSTTPPASLNMNACQQHCVSADLGGFGEREFIVSECRLECIWYRMCNPRSMCKNRSRAG
ncbi:hypothetical protein Ddc_18003 [Ditylenchus destructor]|nr:hypothetical protein Ddc_18003 [Ditylenchus destructor]